MTTNYRINVASKTCVDCGGSIETAHRASCATCFDKRKAALLRRRRAVYSALRYRVLRKLGDKCRFCGFRDARALQIDHVNGGGMRELKFVHTAKKLRTILEMENPETHYQLLCANCNWIKRVENGEYLGT